MAEGKSCFFIGHREADASILAELQQIVERHHTQSGVTEFIVGNYGGFDHQAAEAVIQLKRRFPQITLTLLLPYHPAERPIETPLGFDNTFYPFCTERVPRRLAIVRANRYMVDHADHLIAYAWHPASNARNLLEYAQKREAQGSIQVTLISQK